MALIKCPECGKEVSDKAAACIHCGAPISILRTDGDVSINTAQCGAITRIRIINEQEQELWSGMPGQIATFHVDKPTRISVCWALHKHFRESDAVTVKAGGRYAYQMGSWGEMHLVEVDVLGKNIM